MRNPYHLFGHRDVIFEQIYFPRNTHNRTLQPVHAPVFRDQPCEAWPDVDFYSLSIGCPAIIGEFELAYSSLKNSSVKRAPNDPIQDEQPSQKASNKRVGRMFEETCGGPLGAYPASREYDDFIAYRRRLNPVVSHVHCGYSRFLLNHLQLVPKSFPEWRI